MKCAAIILAAGEASRYGSPKQLLTIERRNLVQRACDLALTVGCSPVVLVLGAHQELIQKEGLPDGVISVTNSNWKKGMGASLSLGIRHVLSSKADTALIMLADQPGVRPSTINSMIESLSQPNTSIVLCSHGKTMGPPALFAAEHFEELSSLNSHFGGKNIAKKYGESVAIISAPEASWDIDNPEEWSKFNSSNQG